MTIALDIPADGPLFAGHFPGRPILPGVTEIALAVEAVARANGLAPKLAALPFARLRQLVLPGDRLTIDARERGSARFRLDVRRGGEPVAGAEIVLGEARLPVDGAAAPILIEGAAPASLPPLDSLMPHRLPMRFVETIVAASDTGIACKARIPSGCALVSEGSAPAIAAVEAAAQAAALWEAVRRVTEGGDGGARIGYLVALRDIAFGATRIHADRAFDVRVRLDALALPLTHYAIEARVDGVLVASGTVATVLAEGG